MTALARLRRLLSLTPFAAAALGAGAAHAQPARLNPVITKAPPGVFAPINGGAALSGPQDVTAPFGLQVVNANTIVNTSGYSPNGVITVQNPSVNFQVPITPNVASYQGSGLNHAYPTVGWQGSVGLEACLSAPEAQAWAGATVVGADTSTCPAEQDLVHARFVARSWYLVASVHVDEYVVQNLTFENAPSSLPIKLQQIDTPMRLHFNGYTFYYTTAHTGSNDANAACQQACASNQHEDVETKSFKVVVLPAALVQLKLLPKTIIYLPPGVGSSAFYKVSNTYTTTLTAGQTTGVDKSQANDQWLEDVDQTGGTASIGKILSLGFTSTDDTRWDNKTTVKTGQSVENDIGVQNQVQTIDTQTVTSTAVNIPGAAGAASNEPFQSDQVVFLVHPQFAVWDFYGKTSMQLIAAGGPSSVLPDDHYFTIAELDACATGASGPLVFPISGGGDETLTAADCRSLASLDPFYGHGQATDVSRRGTLFAPVQSYGTPTVGPPSPTKIEIQNITSMQTTVGTQTQETYASTVEDILATTQSTGLKIGGSSGDVIPGLSLGLSNETTLKQGSNVDTSQTMTLTYKTSNSASTRTDVTVDAIITDSPARPYIPEVAVYLDNLFATLMFVDPTAPAAPCRPQPRCQVAAPINGPGINAPAR